jgi:aerobic carbon-monoxide dehydrogenase large subunit
MSEAERARPARYIGARVKRLEDPRLLSGRGWYLDDIALPGLLHAAFVRSPHAHATILGVETTAAKRLPGVAAILTGRDLVGQVNPLAARLDAPGFVPTAWSALADARVRFVGEPVAIVGADTPYVATDAVASVAVEYEPLPAVADLDAAMAAQTPLVHDTVPANRLYERRQSRGDVDGAFARAPIVLRERFTHARCSAAPLEPRGLVARWEGDALTVWVNSQVPHIVRTALAAAFGLSENRVRVIVPDTGGGFGQKMHLMPEDLAVIALARAVGRCVKWAETRRENLGAATQARQARMDLEVAADQSGTLLALRARVLSDAGAYHVYPLTQALEPLGVCGILPGPYRTPAYAYELLAMATNKPPIGAYRGVGMPFSVFAMERALDLLAERLELDPGEIRRRNFISRDEYPFTSAAGFTYDSGDFAQALAQALAAAGYERLKKARDHARLDGRLRGIGLSCYTEYTGMGSETYRGRGMTEVPGPESARVTMHADGGVSCVVSFPSQGQGHATTVAQIVAEQLGVQLDHVRVSQPDTDASPAGSGTFASRSVVVQMGTVARAAVMVRNKLLGIAAGLMEASPEDLEIRDGRVTVRGVPDRGMPVSQLARLAYAPPAGGLPDGIEPGLVATQFFDPPGPTFSGAVHVAAVEVDPETGHVAVTDYAVVEDCGPLINPGIVAGQIHGAVAQGIGEALGERLVYDEHGQLLSGTLMEYALPRAADLPSFTIGHVETPSPLTPGGYKGMGEGGTVGAPAAIANAVADALRPRGGRITGLPILPADLMGFASEAPAGCQRSGVGDGRARVRPGS